MAATTKLRPIEVAIILAISATMIAASWFHWWPLPLTEVLGFATGGACVWLVVREHLWNWPVGLANNIFFFVLFFESRLYADMSLQVVYFAMGVYGWLHWRFGGTQRTELSITRTTRTEWLTLAAAIPLGTWALHEVLLRVNGAAPLWDALTTVLSLAAQYLLCQKRLENWWIWITADLIYIPLYFSRHLPLTAVLYAVLLTMCLIGLSQWRRHFAPAPVPA
jgi:nicotinamide mononucleotide transporter